MIRILLLVGFIFYSLPSLAKIVTAKGKYMHSGEISTNEGCKLAKEKASLFVTSLSYLKILSEGHYINLLMMNPLDFSKDLMDT